ncbi:hypothetical protein MRX96_000585 [Rhipicephalus microplus]
MASTPKGPYDLETPYQGGYDLTSTVDEPGTPEPRAKRHRSCTRGSSHEQSKHASAREPRNDSVCVLVREVPDPCAAQFLGRSLDSWGFISAAVFALLGLLVFCLGAFEGRQSRPEHQPPRVVLARRCYAVHDIGGDLQRGQRPHPTGCSQDHQDRLVPVENRVDVKQVGAFMYMYPFPST